MGESGSVHITIDNLELDDEEIDFDYIKSAESEWNRVNIFVNTINHKLNLKQVNTI